MPVSGRPPRGGAGSDGLDADWLLSEIGDPSRAPTSTFVQQLRLLVSALPQGEAPGPDGAGRSAGGRRGGDRGEGDAGGWEAGAVARVIAVLGGEGPRAAEGGGRAPRPEGGESGSEELSRELRAREWQAPLLTPLFEAQAGRGPNSPPCPFLNPPYMDMPTVSRDTSSEDEPGSIDVCMEDFAVPQPCSFLSVGTEFHGVQRCTKDSVRPPHPPVPDHAGDPWQVSVQIQCYSLEMGYVCGTMKANVSPQSPVVTFWEGEIVDNENHTFFTSKWDASQSTDLDYWHKFSAFAPLGRKVMKQGGQCGQLKDFPYIFMRWKEKFFISKQEDNHLTIQGFYYICLSRQDGEQSR
eukprot:evm.model.scf_2409.1 EVM.evm.TU.scf_2409.1   scf_2409:3514-7781(+)